MKCYLKNISAGPPCVVELAMATYARLEGDPYSSSSDSDSDGTSSEDEACAATSSRFSDAVEKHKLSFGSARSSVYKIFGGANKYGNLEQRVKWVVETVISGSVLLGVGIFNTLLWMIAKINELFKLFFFGLVRFPLHFRPDLTSTASSVTRRYFWRFARPLFFCVPFWLPFPCF